MPAHKRFFITSNLMINLFSSIFEILYLTINLNTRNFKKDSIVIFLVYYHTIVHSDLLSYNCRLGYTLIYTSSCIRHFCFNKQVWPYLDCPKRL